MKTKKRTTQSNSNGTSIRKASKAKRSARDKLNRLDKSSTLGRLNTSTNNKHLDELYKPPDARTSDLDIQRNHFMNMKFAYEYIEKRLRRLGRIAEEKEEWLEQSRLNLGSVSDHMQQIRRTYEHNQANGIPIPPHLGPILESMHEELEFEAQANDSFKRKVSSVTAQCVRIWRSLILEHSPDYATTELRITRLINELEAAVGL